MMSPIVRIVAKSEKDRALDVFTLAFVDDPVLRWIMADGGVYLRNLGAAQFGLGGRRHLAADRLTS